MYLPDNRFSTLVAFVQGVDVGVGGRLLAGFGDWIHDRLLGDRTNFHWSVIIAAQALGVRQVDGLRELMTDEADRRAFAELMDQLSFFLRGKWPEILASKADAGEARVELGMSEEVLAQAEDAIGRLPADYRLFLSTFGQASVGSDEIFGLGAGLAPYLNVVDMTLAERRDTPA